MQIKDKMPTITITGDTTQEALEEVIYQAIGKHGKELIILISKNLRFENQNKELNDYEQKVIKAIDKLKVDTSGKGDFVISDANRLKKELELI